MRIKVTWVGHATVLIEAGDYRIVTDPALTAGIAHLRRRVPVIKVGPVDAVLISHVHMDHLHIRSLRLLSRGARLLVPAGGEGLAGRSGAASIESVLPGNCIPLEEDVNVRVVHAEHPASRGVHSSVRAEPVGYVVGAATRHIYFAGDTDLFEDMHHLGSIEVALLPIGGWGPTLGAGHLDPTRAATAASWMQPRFIVPIHWGTYSPVRLRRGSPAWLHKPIDRFRQALSNQHLEGRLVVLQPGGSIELN